MRSCCDYFDVLFLPSRDRGTGPHGSRPNQWVFAVDIRDRFFRPRRRRADRHCIHAPGGVLVSEYSGDVFLFQTDSDGQTASGASVAQSFGFANATGMAQVGSNIYMNQATNSNVVQLNANGGFEQLIQHIPNPVANNLTGIAVNPAYGHLFVSTPTTPGSFNEIIEIDPVAKTSSVFASGIFTDGLAFSPDASVLYAATASNSITAFDALSGSVILGPISVNGGPDGIAVGTGSLAGNLFINTNDGEIIDLNLATLSQTVIATGGSRGDLLYVDPTNDTLLVTQTDSIFRLGAPSGGSAKPDANDPKTPDRNARRLWDGREESAARAA